MDVPQEEMPQRTCPVPGQATSKRNTGLRLDLDHKELRVSTCKHSVLRQQNDTHATRVPTSSVPWHRHSFSNSEGPPTRLRRKLRPPEVWVELRSPSGPALESAFNHYVIWSSQSRLCQGEVPQGHTTHATHWKCSFAHRHCSAVLGSLELSPF